MTKDVGILILGLLVAAVPFLGFPAGFERIMLVVMGLSIAVLAFLIRGDFALFSMERDEDTYAESDVSRRDVVGDGIFTEGMEHEHENET